MTTIKTCSSFFNQRQTHKFVSSLLIENQTKLHKIYQHPFNLQLFKGSLPPEVFGCYLRDDYFYLQQFSSTLQKIATRTINVNSDLTYQLNYLAKDIIAGELSMQLEYKEHLQSISDFIPGETISSYTEYLSKNAVDSELSIALCAILPCFWIYHQLGSMNKSSLLSNNPYKDWIATYSSTEFTEATQHLTNTVNLMGTNATSNEQVMMKEAFSTAVQFELDFFDAVYHKEKSFNFMV